MRRPAWRCRTRRRQGGDGTAELEATGHGVIKPFVAAGGATTSRRNWPARVHRVPPLEALALGLEASLALHRPAAEPVLQVLGGERGGAEQLVRRRRGSGGGGGVLRPAAGGRQGADRGDGGRALEPQLLPVLRRVGAEAAAEGQAEAELDPVRLPAGPCGGATRRRLPSIPAKPSQEIPRSHGSPSDTASSHGFHEEERFSMAKNSATDNTPTNDYVLRLGEHQTSPDFSARKRERRKISPRRELPRHHRIQALHAPSAITLQRPRNPRIRCPLLQISRLKPRHEQNTAAEEAEFED